MGIVINTNVASLNAQRSLSINSKNFQKDLQQLSSGYKINSAADDAAGLQISEGLQAQIRGANQAASNAQDGTSLLSVAEGTLSVVQDNLQRVRELTVQAANGTNGTTQTNAIKSEIQRRITDINRITKAAQFNGTKLLSTSTPASLRIQVGANNVASLDTVNIGSALGDARATTLGLGSVNLSTNSKALTFLATVDTALGKVSSRRATIGALQNQLGSAISNLSITSQNLQASDSQIRDVNVAAATADLTKNQILQQASASILTQANQSSQIALTLIRG